MKLRIETATAALLCASLLATVAIDASAAPFVEGNLVVVGVGGGDVPLSGNAAPVYLHEYTTAGELVQTIALPTTALEPSRRFALGGTNPAEGFLNRSVDGRYLTLGGYDAAPGTPNVVNTDCTKVARVVCRVDHLGALDTTTAITDGFSTNRIASVVTDDGSRFWSAGVGIGGGIRFSPVLGATTSVPIAATPDNFRVAQIHGGRLYASVSYLNPNYLGIAAIGEGLPTRGQTATMLPGFPVTGARSHFGFFFKDDNTLFAVDDGRASDGGGLQKWTVVSGRWTEAGSPFPYTFSLNSPGMRGLTGTVDGNTVTIYATTTETTNNKLVRWVSTNGGKSGTFTTLASAPVQVTATAFRGVALAPVATPILPDAESTPTPPGNPFEEHGGLNWFPGFELAEQLARREGRAMLALFVAPETQPYQHLLAITPDDPATRDLLAGFILVRIATNAPDGAVLAQRFSISKVPTLVRFDPNGREESRLTVRNRVTQWAEVAQFLGR